MKFSSLNPLNLPLICLGLLFAVSVGVSRASIMLEDSTPLTPLTGNGGATLTLSNAYTVAESGNNNVLVVLYSARNTGGRPTSATFGDVSLTTAGGFNQQEDGFSSTVEIFYMPETSFDSDFTTASQELVINQNSADDGYVVSAFTLSGVKLSDPIGETGFDGETPNNTDTPLTVDLSSLANDSRIVSVAGSNFQGSVSPTLNVDTELYDNVSGANHRSAAGLTDVTGSDESITYTYNSNGRGAMFAVEFQAIPEPSTGLLLWSLIVGAFAFHRKRRGC